MIANEALELIGIELPGAINAAGDDFVPIAIDEHPADFAHNRGDQADENADHGNAGERRPRSRLDCFGNRRFGHGKALTQWSVGGGRVGGICQKNGKWARPICRRDQAS